MSEQKTKVKVYITTETGCDAQKDEYSIQLTEIVGGINISGDSGEMDLIREAISEGLDDLSLPEEGEVEAWLIESGEWQDRQSWLKWYEIVESRIMPT